MPCHAGSLVLFRMRTVEARLAYHIAIPMPTTIFSGPQEGILEMFFCGKTCFAPTFGLLR